MGDDPRLSFETYDWESIVMTAGSREYEMETIQGLALETHDWESTMMTAGSRDDEMEDDPRSSP
jgi:hypothetical protein